MKILIIIICSLVSWSALACNNSLPESEVVKAIALDPNAGKSSCSNLPEEKCHCFDGIMWQAAELVDNEVLDYNAKDQTESCLDEADCIAKFDALVCIKGEKIRTEIEVYCTYPVYKIEGKKLVESQPKKQQHLIAEENKKRAAELREAAKAQACNALENSNVDAANTVAALRAHVKLLTECKK